MPDAELRRLDDVVRGGRYQSRAEAIRAGVRLLVREERNRAIADSYRRAYGENPQEEWIGEAGAALLAEAIGEQRTCECGCGGRPRGGRFLPGHDAKLKSRLLKSARAGDDEAEAELVRRGWR